ncbi:MAG: biotin transporter BioY [Desulfobacteraceae bacterium]|nr:biotin transporter BioY [Desulfobacteraceae bacterium]
MNEHLHKMVYASLMSALIAAGAFVAIPVGPVPIVMQNMFVMLSGLLLGSRWGLAAICVYLLAGICGLPVFAGGTGGIGKLIGPTGGYLIGYIPAVYLIGMISERFEGRLWIHSIALILAAMIVYVFGVLWLKTVSGMTLAKTLAVGMYPFLIGDAIKIAAAVLIAKSLRPIMERNSVHASA